MLSILLITSQQRLQEIFSEAASARNASLRIAPALGECATEISGAPPDIIFLQNRLSGLSADILLRHVKSLIAEETSVPIVLLCESPSDSLGELFIDTTGTDEKVKVAVDRVIDAELSHESHKQQDIPHSASSEAAERVDSNPLHPTLTEDGAPLPDVADAVSVSGAGTSLNSGDSATGSTPLKFHEELDTLMGMPVAPPQNDHPPPMSGPTVDELLRRPSKPRRKVGGAVALALGVAVAAGIALSLGKKEKGKPAEPTAISAKAEKAVSSVAPTPSPPATAPAPEMQKPVASPPSSQVPGASTTAPNPGIRKTALPSFIPKNAFVQRKGATNGEWEKYVSPAAEYRVFREGSKIKAVQVIDRTGKGITRAFFTRAIHEMAGVRDYSLQSRETKGNILVKKGTLSGNARVILYKRNADTFLQAFVIQYD